MNTNFEQIPAEVFEWLEHHSFGQLSSRQQQTVNCFFSEEEYNELHRTATTIKSVSTPPVVSNERKEALMKQFDKKHDQHHGRKIISLFVSQVIVWQAASAVLLLVSGWLCYITLDLKKDISLQRLAHTDTVFVDHETKQAPEIIHDTVYLYKQAKTARKKAPSIYDTAGVLQESPEFMMLPLKETEHKGSFSDSMKHDGMIRKFGSISL